MASTKSKVPRGWFTKAGMAEIFGVTEQTFDAVYRKHLDASQSKTVGRKVIFRARGVIDAHVAAQAESKPPPPSIDDDPLLASGDSPGLERYRLAKAALAEMDLQTRKDTHVSLDELSPLLLQLAGNIRTAVEDVQRQWGPEPAARINEALDETEQGWLKVVGNAHSQSSLDGSTEGAGGDASAETADD